MIEDFGLHDATLIDVHLEWGVGSCTLMLGHSEFSNCCLTFTGVSNLSLPRARPWGASQSINSACQRNTGHYEIEMQSGDLIQIEACAVTLTRSSNGLN
jgi:hypothetical protein